uniref:Uncharacterized protein n=1 Tax=Vitis vinifera TaxID=29760 RepID=F6GYC4_VITVI
MAARTYSVAPAASNYFDNTTTTAIVQYRGYYTPSSPPSLPHLPAYNDTNASVQVMASLRNLADAKHPCNVPLSTSTKLIYTASLNSYPCINNSCSGANGTRFAASNIKFNALESKSEDPDFSPSMVFDSGPYEVCFLIE